ncbi:DHH family phosphoesterase [Gemella sp. GH3]|uniref:DHH family phosphoesterase n=1 Tax=unclassified Gemella TaxID=2624949 RepID=UPI0015CFB44A|nr:MULTISPECIES: DHH family phosphoesterase [unclassified Gemella]MBF0713688.1 DHH family phosphoesterase [Gemella sp. GH3.1]NYS50640.1 DHH family phosphoesterase [Gemella sp. GH3]
MKKGIIYLIFTISVLFIGAVLMFIKDLYSFFIYLAILIGVSIPIYLYGRKIEENNNSYINEITDRIKDSSEQGLNKFPIGIVIIDNNTKIEWVNNYIYKHLGLENIIGKDILEIVPEIEPLFGLETVTDNQFIIGDKYYKVSYQKDSGYIYFFDITDIKVIMQKFKNTRPAIMTINLDNYEEIKNDLDDYVASRLDSKITSLLTEWSRKYGIYLKRIDEDRFLGLANVKDLKEIEKEKFVILDDIRNLKEDFDSQITLSIGVGIGTDFLPELGELSKTALDLSLGRGGDQVAIKEVDGTIRLFGGKTNPQEKRTRIKARVISNALSDIIKESDRIIVMGHKNPDFDSIGACIGIYEFAKLNNRECYVVLNDSDIDETISKIMLEVENESTLRQIFITNDEAWDLMTIQTTLVIVDTSDPNRVIDIGLLTKATKKVVIDHHRRGEDIIAKPLLTYIEPYASSASELIAEIIEYQSKNTKIMPISATIMLGGIVVDSQNFSIRTGSRTFDAAAYLRSNGADPIKVKTILKEPIENFRNRAEIISNSYSVADNVVVSVAPYDKTYTNVMLAQSADALLTIKDIEASFVVGRLSDKKIGISARSLGNMNVQLVMEQLGGGGHLSNAATQIESNNLEEVKDSLIEKINEILLEN